MAHFVSCRDERYRVIRKVQHEYYVPREEPLAMTLFEQRGKQLDHDHKQDFSHHDQYYYDHDHFQKPYYNQQQNQHVGHKGPYLHATVLYQQPYVAYNPYVQSRTVPKAPHMEGSVTHYQGENYYQQPNFGISTSQVPQGMKKQGGVIDSDEAAKIYGGVVVTEYGRNNKYPRA